MHSRTGISISEEELASMLDAVAPLIRNGLSPEAIWLRLGDGLPVGVRTFYSWMVCFVKQIFRKSSSNSFGSQHERSSDFTKGCGTYPSFLFPSMSESVTRRLSPLNSTSLPWWTILSTSADASLSSANTVPHFPNSMLVVSTIDWRS